MAIMKKSRSAAQDLDAYDLAILRILQANNKTPQRTISEQVNISAAAVQRRIAEMEASGVIRQNVALVDPKALGKNVTVVVEVHLVSDQSAVIRPAKELFAKTPEVQQCYHVTGNGGLILIMLVEDMESYGKLAMRLFADNELVSTFRSLPVLDRVKTGLTVAVD